MIPSTPRAHVSQPATEAKHNPAISFPHAPMRTNSPGDHDVPDRRGGEEPRTPDLIYSTTSPASACTVSPPRVDAYQTPTRDSTARSADSWSYPSYRPSPLFHGPAIEPHEKSANMPPPAIEVSRQQRADSADYRRVMSEDLANSFSSSRFVITPRTSISSESGTEGSVPAAPTGVVFSNRKKRPATAAQAGSNGRSITPGTAPASPVVKLGPGEGFDSDGLISKSHKCPSDLRVFDVVGEGVHGIVHRASWRGRTCAVKRCHDKAAERYLRRECQISRAVVSLAARSNDVRDCPVLEILAEVQHGGRYAVVATLANGDLWQVVKRGSIAREGLMFDSKSQRSLSASALLTLARQAAVALADLHALDVVHSDVKPQNFVVLDRTAELATLLALTVEQGTQSHQRNFSMPADARRATSSESDDLDKFRVVLIDLENAYSPTGKVDCLKRSSSNAAGSEVVGTSAYTAPELLVRHRLSTPPPSPDLSADREPTSATAKADFAADVFSFGCTLLALFSGEEPLVRARSVLERSVWSQRGDPIKYLSAQASERFDAAPSAVKDIVRRSLASTVRARPTAAAIVDALRSVVE